MILRDSLSNSGVEETEVRVCGSKLRVLAGESVMSIEDVFS
jgi:hypothetical protein